MAPNGNVSRVYNPWWGVNARLGTNIQPSWSTTTTASQPVSVFSTDSISNANANSGLYPSVFSPTGSIQGSSNAIVPSYGTSSTDETQRAAAASAVPGTVATTATNTSNNITNANAAQAAAESDTVAPENSASALKPSTLGNIYDDETGNMTPEEQQQRARAAREFIMLPTLNEAVKKEVLSNEDVEKYLSEGKIPDEKQAAFQEFCQGLRNNKDSADEIFSKTLEEKEGEMVSNNPELEALYKEITTNEGIGSIVTDEELEKLKELAGETEETEKPEETEEMEERPADQEGDPAREEEVIAAYNSVMDAMESGQDLKSFAEKSGNSDVKRIVSDIEDDGIVGNGAAAEQFESNVIQNAIQKRSQKACDNNATATIGGKTVNYNGSFDKNDNKTTSSRKGNNSNSSNNNTNNTKTEDPNKKPEEN